MKRRETLSIVGSVIAVGCIGGSPQDEPTATETPEPTPTAEPTPTREPTPTPEPTPTREPTPEPLEDSVAFSELEKTAQQRGISLTYTFIGSDRAAYFEYTDGGKDREEREADVREFTKTYLDLRERGWNSEWLEAALIGAGETITFSWAIEPEWVESYRNGEMTKTEVAEKTVGTIM